MNVDIRGLNQAAVVAALYNNARVQGMGAFVATNEDMTPEQAQTYIDEFREQGISRFDYLKGRVMKVELVKAVDEFDPRLYDRDNGQGAAARVVAALR